MTMRLTSLALTTALTATVLASAPAFAEPTISVYGGHNSSPHSRVHYDFNDGQGRQHVTPAWDGLSFEAPPYYGLRATWWMDSMPNVGFAVDFTHAKVAAQLPEGGFTKLEFTDGINFLTANALYRWDNLHERFTPYVGAGVGLTIPKVEVNHVNLAQETNEYQVTGAAGQVFVGVDFALTENWSVFGEYKFSAGQVDGDLVGGGNIETRIFSNQAIFGVTYKFK